MFQTHCSSRKNYVPNALLIKEIREFYERDDISRTSPKIRDVKEYVSVDTGENILLPTRHMILTMKEAFALFDEERKNAGKSIWNYSILHYKGRNTAIANECEVCCPSEARTAVTRIAFAVFCFE